MTVTHYIERDDMKFVRSMRGERGCRADVLQKNWKNYSLTCSHPSGLVMTLHGSLSSLLSTEFNEWLRLSKALYEFVISFFILCHCLYFCILVLWNKVNILLCKAFFSKISCMLSLLYHLLYTVLQFLL